MSQAWTWMAAGLTLTVLIAYELLLYLLQHRRPGATAWSTHAFLREDWFVAVSTQKGSEILAVQTLRNSLMSATMLASTAALALMGAVTLAAPSLHASFDLVRGVSSISPRLVLEVVLIVLLCASLISTVMAVRFYNHAGFIGGMPVASDARVRWEQTGKAYVRKAGILYGLGLRQLVLVVPVVAAILLPMLGPFVALLVTSVLFTFDHQGAAPARASS